MTRNPGKVISRDDFKNILGSEVNERSIDVQIKRLREKIEEHSSNPKHLKTVRGQGYVFY